jgi:hypothetical protein
VTEIRLRSSLSFEFVVVAVEVVEVVEVVVVAIVFDSLGVVALLMAVVATELKSENTNFSVQTQLFLSKRNTRQGSEHTTA